MAVPVLTKASQPVQGQAGPVQPGQQAPPQAGREEAKQLKTAISFINLALILPLFAIYAGIYRKMKSSFTLGLMAVIFALGMYAVTSNPLVVGTLGGRIGDIGLFQIIPDLCATAALLILIRISLE
jgi:tellurite resistance protein TehA-like permease